MKKHHTCIDLNLAALAGKERVRGNGYVTCHVCEKPVRLIRGIIPPVPHRHKKDGAWCPGGADGFTKIRSSPRRRAELKAKREQSPSKGRYGRFMEANKASAARRAADADSWIEQVRLRKKP